MANRLLAFERHGRCDILVFQALQPVYLAAELDVRNCFYVKGKAMHRVR